MCIDVFPVNMYIQNSNYLLQKLQIQIKAFDKKVHIISKILEVFVQGT